jgi:hypothetical protein
VSSTHCGYSKPIGYLIIGAIFLISGVLSSQTIPMRTDDKDIIMGIGFVIGAILFIKYFLSKKIVIAIETNGGIFLGLSFKRSVIEDVTIEMELALKVIEIINKKVIDSQVKQQISTARFCTGCGAAVDVGSAFCAQCGVKS